MSNVLVDQLNLYLSDLQVLNVKVHNYHWNIVGSSFFSLHKAFEGLYDGLQDEIDDVAERILQIGGKPLTSLTDYAKTSGIQEAPSKDYTASEALGALKADYTYLVKTLSKAVQSAQESGDEGTVDFFVGALKDKQKTLWMLEASAR